MANTIPRLAGRALAAARAAAEAPATSAAMRMIMRRSLDIDLLSSLPEAHRGEVPMDHKPLSARPPRRRDAGAPGDEPPRPWPRTAATYGRAYREGSTTPLAVAERALEQIKKLGARRPSLNIAQSLLEDATIAEARAAADRLSRGAPIGPLDGVPFLVKDEFDVAGLPTTLGTRCEDPSPLRRDSTVVARLRAAGAVFVCKTVLTEWGMSPIGYNPSASMPLNPHDTSRAAGGSSTGSAVGVALGLGPIAAGGDGGGSIRIPSALNGVFGIKPTFGRVSRAGDGFKGSVAHAGPIGASPADLAAFLDAVASEPDPEDELTLWAPPPPAGGFGALLGAGVRGLRIGVDDEEWSHASVEVARAGRAALEALARDGAEIVPVRLHLAPHAARIGYCTIGPETLATHRRAWIEQRDKLGDDLRLVFAVLSGFTALEQLDAQRLRAGLRREVAEALRRVDFLALPTTAITAPPCSEQEARAGFSDPVALDGLCRYAFLGNLTGLPAATAPVGVDPAGLPIGLQIIGDAWDEAGVLGVLAHLERSGAARVRRPPAAIDLVPETR
ncbi:MAG: amidase [Polyangiaceae bacterium]|nr:amidase [Polyangiaceae bacterium]